jgi:hypothetical protein
MPFLFRTDHWPFRLERGRRCRVILPQQLRQLGEVGRDPPGLVPYGVVEKIDIATVSTLRRSANNLLKSLRRGCANAVQMQP